MKGFNFMKLISIDPGINGAIFIKDDKNNISKIYNMPTYKDKNDKNNFCIEEIVKIIEEHKDANILVLEDVHCVMGNGAVSMFNFGRGKGILEGIAFSFKLKVIYVSPQIWKKNWEELMAPKIDKEQKSKYTKKELQKIKSQNKANSKTKARELAGKLEPDLIDKFKKVKDDGPAEAVLIAHYIKKQHIEGKLTI